MSDKKILILVLSFTDEPYLSLMRAQQNSWDSIEVEGVRTVYYYGGGKGWVNDKEFSADASDIYFYMTKKCILAMKEVLNNYDAQLIFRTNSSSYCNLQKLKEFAETLPHEKLYAGWTMIDTNYDSKACVSGAGIWFSRDTAQILIDNCDYEIEKEEDIVIGRCLRDHGIEAVDDRSRIDYDFTKTILTQELLDAYHIRFKTADRNRDVENMKDIHSLINKNQ